MTEKVPTITVHPDQPLADLGDLYGIFFEDLNHAADGGLYAEMVQNRSFEFCSVDAPDYHALTAWEDAQGAPLTPAPLALRVLSDAPLNSNNLHYLQIDTHDPRTFRNHGYGQGMAFRRDAVYRFSVFARKLYAPVTLTVALTDDAGQILASGETVVTSDDWHQYFLTLTSRGTTAAGRLQLTVSGNAHVSLDMISLFPKDTFHHRINGVREDIGEQLAALHPRFMRFPGGCLVHDGSLDPRDRDAGYRWKNTIGPVEARPARRNSWGYNQTLGLGYYELFQLAEDIGAKPLPVLPGGWDPHHQWAAPMAELQPFIDDALDLIEFANGPVDSEWGAKRAAMGHPQPFHLEYLAIGNEEVGQEFFDRYPRFHNQIKARYPDIKLINSAGPFAAGSEFDRGWTSARQHHSDLVDEHYYMSPRWFLANQHRYDTYDAHGPKVFLGEYASHGNTWANALAEASYMIGLERNAAKVGLACYAPLLCNTDYVNWRPDLIWYDQQHVTGSVNYDVQKLFMTHQGSQNIAHEEANLPAPLPLPAAPTTGAVRFQGADADITYSNISYTDLLSDTTTQLADGTVTGQDQVPLLAKTSGYFRLTFDFVKTGGRPDKGMRLDFGVVDDQHRFGWSLGGWQNQDALIEQIDEGGGSALTQSIWHVSQNVPYHCELTVDGDHLTGKIDGHVFNDVRIPSGTIPALYINSVRTTAGQTIVKLVNVQDTANDARIAGLPEGAATIETLQAPPAAENTVGQPDQVQQDNATGQPAADGTLPVHVPAHSIVFVMTEGSKKE
ncbi:alpha-L-arabinofuranosidase C-terminal domain-containing protein [Schleiferilactobacillus shenzhenensis]|uniref:non-reducing end alpha-L-arabinofuranosidase n=1 Tax=Schleiferilactobacillus shenzhenensis LY-73 TaxID=1231336 RepID=U4THP3_9LACO|nr:alpha-L-arabinofuranosidase C-terminal domain-containing protein [Schleiferilactobacillus shenzhenensis]ERL63684.1 alpha-N-arabinofuranosidase [Schleiferilactobacillus shenzhenensis LY-73]